MGILRVDHPDIEEFIAMKMDGKSVANFNLSVAITDDFMRALKNGGNYDIVDPYLKKKAGKKSARKVFDAIVHSAWLVGDPGLIFIDRINQHNPTRGLGPIRATNPCGEQPLHDYESCNLGSLNLSHFYSPRKKDRFDWDRFAKSIGTAVRFLDNVIEVNRYPLPQIEETSKANRRIGLGVMGWADLLIKMKIRYDTPEALELAEKVAGFLRAAAAEESRNLAEKRESFPNIEKSVYKGKAMRNATVITIAPTGTISRLAGCSSSIEPVFALEFTSKIIDGELKDVHPLYAEWRDQNPGRPTPDYFVTAHDIAPEWHIRMQAAFQKHVDNPSPGPARFPAFGHGQDQDRLRQPLCDHLLSRSETVRGVHQHRQERVHHHGGRRGYGQDDLPGPAQRGGPQGCHQPAQGHRGVRARLYGRRPGAVAAGCHRQGPGAPFRGDQEQFQGPLPDHLQGLRGLAAG
jgi:ribonucleoside-diphosphate reductase alpha chain